MQALDDFMRAMQTRRIIKSEWIDRAENALTTILGGDYRRGGNKCRRDAHAAVGTKCGEGVTDVAKVIPLRPSATHTGKSANSPFA